MLYRHLQNALAVIFIMDAHNDNSVHPQLAQSFNSGCFSVFSSIRANQHHLVVLSAVATMMMPATSSTAMARVMLKDTP